MNNKLTKQDILILDEGMQVKRLIELRYGSLREFYEKENLKQLSLKAIRNYCSYAKVSSYTFKLMLVQLFEKGWDEIVHTPSQQLSIYIYNVFHNIVLYKDKKDMEFLNYLLDLCIKYDMKNETALMYRNIAKNCYYTNDRKQAIELYNKAIDLLNKGYINTLLILHVELAKQLYMERNIKESEQHFAIAEGCTKHSGIDRYSIYTYYYQRGLIYNSLEQYTTAREYFTTALEYADTNGQAISEAGAALLAIGTSFKREHNYEDARAYYFKSMFYFDDDDTRGRGTAYNNIADIFYMLGDYESASSYIEKAMSLLGKEGTTTRLLACAHTNAQIKLIRGDVSAYHDLLEILRKTTELSLNRGKIIYYISSMIEVLDDNVLLNKLENTILYLINNTSNETYQDELYSCIGRLSIKIKHKEESR